MECDKCNHQHVCKHKGEHIKLREKLIEFIKQENISSPHKIVLECGVFDKLKKSEFFGRIGLNNM